MGVITTGKRIQKKIPTIPALFLTLLLLVILHLSPKQHGTETQMAPYMERNKDVRRVTGERPGKVLILSSYRSGSSLMGELVATTSTSTMYEFEPTAHAFTTENSTDGERGRLCLDILSTLFNCSGQYNQSQIDRAAKFSYFRPTNFKVMKIFNSDWKDSFLWETHPSPREEQQLRDYTEFVCRESQLKLIKTIRLPVLDFYNMYHILYTLLEKFPDLVIIGAVRDPRDSYASRKKFGGGPGFERTPMELENICNNYSSIIKFVDAIKQSPFGPRVSLVKYEELYNDPIAIVSKTFSQLSLPVSQRTTDYIRANIMNEKGGDLENTANHGFFTKPRDKNATIGYWKTLNIDPVLLANSAQCISQYERAKSTVLVKENT